MRPATGVPALVCSRQYAAACRVGANTPFRWTAITASHSDSSMLVSMRSRRIPALLTSVSRRPNVSIARWTMRPAPAKSATFSPSATASPPMPLISSTTSIAGLSEPPSPCMSPPRSLTTTFAPSAAYASACSRPIPRPAPVTMTTRPSQIPIAHPHWSHAAGAAGLFRTELLAQLVFVELAVVVPGQRLGELDPAGTLVVRDALATPLDELGSQGVRRLDAGLRLDHGNHDLAPIVVGDAHHADVAHCRMADEHRLDLGRVDVHAAADDEVGAAVGEEQVAVVVDVPDVAQREVVAGVRAFGLLGRLVILEARAVGRRRLQVDGADVTARRVRSGAV